MAQWQSGCFHHQKCAVRTQSSAILFNVIIENTNHVNYPKPTTSTSTYTQLESEINLVCLAHWKHNGNHVIVSRTMTNEVLCSVI